MVIVRINSTDSTRISQSPTRPFSLLHSFPVRCCLSGLFRRWEAEKSKMRQEYLSDIARMRQEMQDTLMIGITCHNDSSILNSVAIAGHAFFKYVSAGRLRPKSTGCKKADKTGLEGMIVIIWCYMMLYDVIWCYMMLYVWFRTIYMFPVPGSGAAPPPIVWYLSFPGTNMYKQDVAVRSCILYRFFCLLAPNGTLCRQEVSVFMEGNLQRRLEIERNRLWGQWTKDPTYGAHDMNICNCILVYSIDSCRSRWRAVFDDGVQKNDYI